MSGYVSPCCGMTVYECRAFMGGDEWRYYECLGCGRPCEPITAEQHRRVIEAKGAAGAHNTEVRNAD